jgi:hypothetical protein
MAKSADAADLKSAGRKAVGVQVPLWAPIRIKSFISTQDLLSNAVLPRCCSGRSRGECNDEISSAAFIVGFLLVSLGIVSLPSGQLHYWPLCTRNSKERRIWTGTLKQLRCSDNFAQSAVESKSLPATTWGGGASPR